MEAIKLVVWDLDETFWRGTLGEEKVILSQTNISLVKELASRGIVSSICAKNNFNEAKTILEQAGIWSFFVFPNIDFSPKGQRLLKLKERIGFRPENTLFIDDNPLNRFEAQYYCPGINVADPAEVLSVLLTLESLKGNEDRDLVRLSQYRHLEIREAGRESTPSSNEDFLRKSSIRIRLDYSVELHFERIVELINRANQLNFTKKRFGSLEEIQSFKQSLREYGTNAGAIFAEDKYGDYGLIGFFELKIRPTGRSLVHFVFSCRVLNMGIEQFVYESLGRPVCKELPPLANQIVSYDKVDWIEEVTAPSQGRLRNEIGRVLLLGGCELLQMGIFFGEKIKEFVNSISGENLVRFDDAGFILSSRMAMKKSRDLPKLEQWQASDAVGFDYAIAEANIIILALNSILSGDYIHIERDIFFRLSPDEYGANLYQQVSKVTDKALLQKISLGEKLEYLRKSLDRISLLASRESDLFLLGANTKSLPAREAELANAYNQFSQKYCEENKQFVFIDVDSIVPTSELLENLHFSRQGYFGIAREIHRYLAQTRNSQIAK